MQRKNRIKYIGVKQSIHDRIIINAYLPVLVATCFFLNSCQEKKPDTELDTFIRNVIPTVENFNKDFLRKVIESSSYREVVTVDTDKSSSYLLLVGKNKSEFDIENILEILRDKKLDEDVNSYAPISLVMTMMEEKVKDSDDPIWCAYYASSLNHAIQYYERNKTSEIRDSIGFSIDRMSSSHCVSSD